MWCFWKDPEETTGFGAEFVARMTAANLRAQLHFQFAERVFASFHALREICAARY